MTDWKERARTELAKLGRITKHVITDLAGQSAYLVRWSLWLPFGASLKVHRILRPDDDRCAHDHPWWFLRVILRGGYTEVHGPENRERVLRPWRPWAPWRLYWCPPGFRHRITALTFSENWSLVLCGPRNRDWGFFTRSGWMQWMAFVGASREKRVLWCDDGRALLPEPLASFIKDPER